MRRKRCVRYNEPGDAHELTFSCYKNRSFLAKERTCRYLADAIERSREKHKFDLWAYVFMPTHAHVLVWPTTDPYLISRVLTSIKQSVSRRALIYLRKHNPIGLQWVATGQKHVPYRFWQDGGGDDRNIRSPETLKAMVEYIHNNPVRAGLVDGPEDWFWSSAREWNEEGVGPLAIDRDSFPLV